MARRQRGIGIRIESDVVILGAGLRVDDLGRAKGSSKPSNLMAGCVMNEYRVLIATAASVKVSHYIDALLPPDISIVLVSVPLPRAQRGAGLSFRAAALTASARRRV
ncbi:MAG: hypothetical protein R3E54_18015 [Halioglobus sp.]